MEPPVYGDVSGDPEGPRLHRFLTRPSDRDVKFAIVGFPVDEGVVRNGGRRGAAAAPAEIRRYLSRFTPDAAQPARHIAVLETLADLGDIALTGALETDQARLGEVVSVLFASGICPIIIGGGHETAFGHFLGYRPFDLPHIVNFDAHADVRPLRDGYGHSGSPFRQAMEFNPAARGYSVFGLQPSSVASSHIAYLDRMRADYGWCRDLSLDAIVGKLATISAPVMATVDMDVVRQSDAPGVSAPAPAGIDGRLLLDIAFELGASPDVRSLDIVEVNPQYDLDGRTARLAATAIWQFLRGAANRMST